MLSSNRKIDLYSFVSKRPETQDQYLINEPIHMARGSIMLSNVEEFGPANSNVAAIIHYFNTTDEVQVFRIKDFGAFTDGNLIYNMKTADAKEHQFKPGESDLFKVVIEKEKGTDKLYFVPSDNFIIDSDASDKHKRSEVLDPTYIGVVNLTTQTDPEIIAKEKELHGIAKKSDVLDLSLAENQHQIFRNSVEVDSEGKITGMDKDETLVNEQGKEVQPAANIQRKLTKAEKDALATTMTDEEIKRAIEGITLPGLSEWGATVERINENNKPLRDIGGLRVLTQDKYFEG